MFEKVLVEQNPHWEHKGKEIGIIREKLKHLLQYIGKKHVLIITGVRRCGKSYLMRQIQKEVLQTENPKNIFFLNLENPYFDEYREKVIYLEKIFDEYLSLTQANPPFFVFFDEVQFFHNWQVFVKSKYEIGNTKFFLTGSNAWLLSSEFATLLSGRTMQFEMYPFSFREFLHAKNIDASTKIKQAVHERVIKNAFKEYMQWGGFPEVVLTDDIEQKKELLTNYYTNIVYKDIVPRFHIENLKQIQELARYLLSNIGKVNSYNQLSPLLNLSDKTVREYINYFSQGYLLFEVHKYAFSLKKQMTYLKKIYAVDTGFASALGFQFSEDVGRFLENNVFIELKRQGKEIYYHREKKECDFIIKQGLKIIEAVQVCKELNQENKERELAGLLEALITYNLKKGMILTMDQEDEFQRQGCKILVIPVWKWLLSQ